VSQVFTRYEGEELPKLRLSSQLRTAGIVAQLRGWFVQGPLHDPFVTNVRPDHVAAFLEKKRTEGVSPRTVNLYRATLHRLFRLCVRPRLLIPSNPPRAATSALWSRNKPRRVFKHNFRSPTIHSHLARHAHAFAFPQQGIGKSSCRRPEDDSGEGLFRIRRAEVQEYRGRARNVHGRNFAFDRNSLPDVRSSLRVGNDALLGIRGRTVEQSPGKESSRDGGAGAQPRLVPRRYPVRYAR